MQAGGGDGLLDSQDELQSQFEGLQEEPNAVAEEGKRDGDGGHCCVEPEVVCGCDDDEEDEERVGEGCDGVEGADHGGKAGLAAGFAQEGGDEAGVVEECRADCEGVGEVERGHGSQLVDVARLDPDALGVLLSDGVLEAVGFGEEARRHARVECEDEECGKVAEGHSAADEGVGVVVWRDKVIPGEEAGIEVSGMLRAMLQLRRLTQQFQECERESTAG